MNEEQVIIWQKWIDPYGLDDSVDLSPTIDTELPDPKFFNSESEEYEEDKEIYEDKTENFEMQRFNGGIKIIATPMGFIPLTENTSSSKIFNFWVGHTNFDITEEVGHLIEDSVGVEALDIFTRYRFRIAVGKAFKDSEVMREINNKVYKHVEENN